MDSLARTALRPRTAIGPRLRSGRLRGRRRPQRPDPARTMAVAAQIAALCPGGIDVWAQRELAGLGAAAGEGGRPR